MPRPMWKGAISFGLVTIPVNLYSAVEGRETLAFHLLHKKDGSRYEGAFRNAKFNGPGTMTTANGSGSQGGFRDGRLNGTGFLTAPHGYRHEGVHRNGKANGEGVATLPAGRR